MTDSPSSAELLDAVVVFLRERVLPQLDAASALDARIAASLLQMVRRELARPPGEEAEEVRRLQSLVGNDCSDLSMPNRRLCDWIAQGLIDPRDDALQAYLWAVTLAKLAIDQPRASEERSCPHGCRLPCVPWPAQDDRSRMSGRSAA